MRFIHDNLYPLLAALIFIAATTCWFGTSDPMLPNSAPHAAETWRLPQTPEHASKQSTEAITARNLWGTLDTDNPQKPEWLILGIATSGAERFVLLAYENKPVETLKVGDALPDGMRIVQIEKTAFS